MHLGTGSLMLEFLLVAVLFVLAFYGWHFFDKKEDTIAIRLRRDGKYDHKRVSSEPEGLPLLLKMILFIAIAGILFIPIDFILNRP